MRNLGIKLFDGLVFVALTVASFSLYSRQYWEIGRRDQLPYMRERAYFPSDWDWFWHSVNFTRERLLMRGDAFLYRPILFGIHALNDIFFRHRPEIQGSFSIFFWALAAFAFFKFCEGYFSRTFSFLWSVLFLAHATAFELVLWRHISPYILAVAFVTLALALVNAKKSAWIITVLIFAACLIHEIVPLTLLCAVVLLGLVGLWNRNRFDEIGAIKTLIIPLAGFGLVYSVDLIFHPIVSILNPEADKFTGNLLMQGLFTTYYTSAALAASFFFPMFVKFEQSSNLDLIAIWRFDSYSPEFLLGFALFTLLFALGIGVLVKQVSLARSWRGRPLSLLFILMMIAVLIGGLSLGRGLLRGTSYLEGATYYLGFAAMIYYLLVAALVGHFKSGKFGKWRWPAFAILGVLVGSNIFVLEGTLADMEDLHPNVTAAHLAVDRWMDAHSDTCLMAFDPTIKPARIEFRNFARHLCKPHDETRMPLLLRGSNERLITVYAVNLVPKGETVARSTPSINEVCIRNQGCRKLIWREVSSGDVYSEIEVSNLLSLSVIFAYENPMNFKQFGIYPGAVQCQRNLNGDLIFDLCAGEFTWFTNPLRIGIHFDGKYANLLVNGVQVAKMEEGTGRRVAVWREQGYGPEIQQSPWVVTNWSPELQIERELGKIEL
jgi:hypothetical protein